MFQLLAFLAVAPESSISLMLTGNARLKTPVESEFTQFPPWVQNQKVGDLHRLGMYFI